MALDDDGVLSSALVCLVDAIRNGTTTLFDHHASPVHIDGSLDIIAGAVEAAGLRAVLCYEVTDRNGPEGAAAGIAENVRFIKAQRARRARSGDRPEQSGDRPEQVMLSGLFGLHASLSLSDETLAQCVAEAEALGDVGFHVHAAEGPADQEDSLAKYGLRTVDRLRAPRHPRPAQHRGPRDGHRRLGDGGAAQERRLGDAPAAQQHEQRRGRGRRAGHAARRHAGAAGQRRLLQRHVHGDEDRLPAAQGLAQRPALPCRATR